MRRVDPGGGQRSLTHDLVAEPRCNQGRSARRPVLGGPCFLQDQDVGVERLALGEHVVVATPSVDPHVDVETGHAQGAPATTRVSTR